MRSFVLVTGNRGKLDEAERILGTAVEAVDLELPEIQSLDLVEVLHAKAAEAWQRLQRPLVVDETGLELSVLSGFPGPLIKWMLQAMGTEGITQAVHSLGEARAVARCALLFTDGRERLLGIGETRGMLVSPGRGELGFGWDPIFQPEGYELTYAEMGSEIKDAIGHRGRAWRDLLPRL